MSTAMPVLETARLRIRPFSLGDLDAIRQILDIELADSDLGDEALADRSERELWLRWSVLNHTALAGLNQPPYGDRAIALKSDGRLIGAVGYVPCLMPFEQLPTFAPAGNPSRLSTAEVGLYWAISPAHQRRGYASEAGRAMVDYAFDHLQLKRIVATTAYDNAASIGVMRRLGMRLDRNPLPDPPWLQVVGRLENPASAPLTPAGNP